MTTRQANVGGLAPAQELEDQLRETVQRYQLVFRATNEVLYDLNIETGAIIWNDGLFTLYGYDRTEKVSSIEWWAGHIHPDDALRVEEQIMSWLEGNNETWQVEYRFRKADGSYADVRDRGVVQRDQDHNPMRVIGSFVDITRQKQLDKAKDEFISLVSHQLRTPLTAIRLYSEMLSSGIYGELGDNQMAPVRHITDSSIRLIDLVGNILDISKVELGHIVSNPVPVDIKRLLQAHINEVTPLTSAKGVEVRFEYDETIDMVAVDTTIFGQIMHNLLTNSIRYNSPDKPWVRVSFVKNNEGYLLSVKDNGIGIPESSRPYIFDRFYRAINAKEADEQGTGLGLYMIKMMSETAGCKVWFNTKEGKGTTFYVQIPHDGMRAG